MIVKTKLSTYVICNNEFYRESVMAMLQNYPAPEKDVTIVIDAPWGFAFQRVQAKSEVWIVITDSPCPEYWEDLWDLEPTAVVAGNKSIEEIMQVIYRAASGERSKVIPFYEQKLTFKERKILRFCAQGCNDKEIAKHFEQSQQTISNSLKVIYDKLELPQRNRTSAALYYWGIQGNHSK